MKLSLQAQIEAILFFKTDAISIKKLGELLNADKKEIEEALILLEQSLSERGVSLTRLENEVMLTTSKEISPLIEKLSKEELEGDLSRASMETLAIILYQGSATKSEIDYIRGVNSSFILRALQIRGLVERIPNPKDQRSFVYKPTFDLHNYLGISKKEELPEYSKLVEELKIITSNENSPAKEITEENK